MSRQNWPVSVIVIAQNFELQWGGAGGGPIAHTSYSRLLSIVLA